MIDALEQACRIKLGKTRLVEATSKDTGIGLAFVAAARGYRLTIWLCRKNEEIALESVNLRTC